MVGCLKEDPDAILKFHTLKPSNQVTPWRMQLHSRQSTLYELMQAMIGNTSWQLLATTLKRHNHYMHPAAKALQTMMNMQGTKGTGKGKGKTKGKPPHKGS